MELDIYQADAFTDAVFGGNPAAVVPLDAWLPTDLMQALGRENNLSETAFFVPTPERSRPRFPHPLVHTRTRSPDLRPRDLGDGGGFVP